MRVQCNNCGKSYDYEKQEGFCPYCSTYMAAKPAEQPKTEKTVKSKKKRKKKMPVFIYAVILLILIPVITPYAAEAIVNGRYKKERLQEMEPRYYEIGETMEIGPCKMVVETVEKTKELSHTKAPEGYDFLVIHYKASDGQALKGRTRMYLKVDGEYVYSASFAGSLLENGSANNVYINNVGEIGFTVPEEAKELELLIQHYDGKVAPLDAPVYDHQVEDEGIARLTGQHVVVLKEVS